MIYLATVGHLFDIRTVINELNLLRTVQNEVEGIEARRG